MMQGRPEATLRLVLLLILCSCTWQRSTEQGERSVPAAGGRDRRPPLECHRRPGESTSNQFPSLSPRGETPCFPTWPAELQRRTLPIVRSFQGELGLYVRVIGKRGVYDLHAQSPFYLASTVKVPLLVALLHEAREGNLDLRQRITLSREHYRDGGHHLMALPEGTELSLEEVASYMVEKSDNAATDLLFDRLGVERVNHLVRELGFAELGPLLPMLEVRRAVWGFLEPRARSFTAKDFIDLWLAKTPAKRVAVFNGKLRPRGTFTVADLDRAFAAFYSSGYNTSTLEAFAGFLERLYLRQVLGDPYDGKVLNLMGRCETGANRLRKHFPPQATFAHKTGTQHQLVVDLGLAELPCVQGVLIAAYARKFKTRTGGDAALASLGRATLQALCGE